MAVPDYPIPMPEPPPPPPGWIPPSARVRSPPQTVRPPSYSGNYPSIPTVPPASSASWNGRYETTVRNRHLSRTPNRTPSSTPYSTPPQTPPLQQMNWNQGWSSLPYYETPPRFSTPPSSPVTAQPQWNAMQVRTPSYDYRGPIIKQEVLKQEKQVEPYTHWLETQVPPDTTVFGLIGETLLCPIKVAWYILGELFSRSR